MLLAIDIGNTNLVIGCIENDKILFKARIATDADAYELSLIHI